MWAHFGQGNIFFDFGFSVSHVIHSEFSHRSFKHLVLKARPRPVYFVLHMRRRSKAGVVISSGGGGK